VNKQFIECDTCKAKPGSPTLCAGCINNRRLIAHLQRESQCPSMDASETRVTIIKAPFFYGPHFWWDVFAAAKDAGVHVVIVKGSLRIQQPSGGGATINNFSLFGPRS
jgi:hypothetical protein